VFFFPTLSCHVQYFLHGVQTSVSQACVIWNTSTGYTLPVPGPPQEDGFQGWLHQQEILEIPDDSMDVDGSSAACESPHKRVKMNPASDGR